MSMESRSTKSRRRKPPDVFPHLLTRALSAVPGEKKSHGREGGMDSMPSENLQELWNGLAGSQQVRLVLLNGAEISDAPLQFKIQ